MTRILSNLPEAYDNIVDNLEDEFCDDSYPLTIEMIHDKLSAKYD